MQQANCAQRFGDVLNLVVGNYGYSKCVRPREFRNLEKVAQRPGLLPAEFLLRIGNAYSLWALKADSNNGLKRHTSCCAMWLLSA